MDRRKETNELREWLQSIKDQDYSFVKIAARSLVTLRAIQAISSGQTKAANPTTIKALQSARRWWDKQPK